MTTQQIHCVRCGSADARAIRIDETSGDGTCPRCDNKHFHATPCANCGGYNIDGTLGEPGITFETPRTTVTCRDCRHSMPARDPGPAAGRRYA